MGRRRTNHHGSDFYEHIRTFSGETEEVHQSDNVAAYMQYDQRFWDRLSVSAGVMCRILPDRQALPGSRHKGFREQDSFPPRVPCRAELPASRLQLPASSFGQGYRNPSITEKYLRKDIGGVGVYPNYNVQPEKRIQCRAGIQARVQGRQFTRICRCRRFLTQYKDMVEFQFGLFNNADLSMINSVTDAIQNAEERQGFRHRGTVPQRVQSTDLWNGNQHQRHVHLQQNAKLLYNLGYVYTEPRDADYKKRNALENTYTDPLQMKEKSNDGKYLKYRPKHSSQGHAGLSVETHQHRCQRKLEKQDNLPWTILCWTNAAKVNLTCWTTCAASHSARPTGKPWHPIGKSIIRTMPQWTCALRGESHQGSSFPVHDKQPAEQGVQLSSHGSRRATYFRRKDGRYILKKNILILKTECLPLLFPEKNYLCANSQTTKRMEFPSSRPASRCWGGTKRKNSKHIQTVVPPESMHLCTLHRRFHHGIHQSDGYGNQARGFHYPASRNHHTVLRTKGKSVPGIRGVFFPLPSMESTSSSLH